MSKQNADLGGRLHSGSKVRDIETKLGTAAQLGGASAEGVFSGCFPAEVEITCCGS
jgi:hypothetical protein